MSRSSRQSQSDFSGLISSMSASLRLADPESRKAYLAQLDEIRKKMEKDLAALQKQR